MGAPVVVLWPPVKRHRVDAVLKDRENAKSKGARPGSEPTYSTGEVWFRLTRPPMRAWLIVCIHICRLDNNAKVTAEPMLPVGSLQRTQPLWPSKAANNMMRGATQEPVQQEAQDGVARFC